MTEIKSLHCSGCEVLIIQGIIPMLSIYTLKNKLIVDVPLDHWDRRDFCGSIKYRIQFKFLVPQERHYYLPVGAVSTLRLSSNLTMWWVWQQLWCLDRISILNGLSLTEKQRPCFGPCFCVFLFVLFSFLWKFFQCQTE